MLNLDSELDSLAFLVVFSSLVKDADSRFLVELLNSSKPYTQTHTRGRITTVNVPDVDIEISERICT